MRISKQLLRKVLRRASLTYEELLTVLCDFEAVANAGPLIYVSKEVTDLIPLTAMFIQDIKEVGIPEFDSIESHDFNQKRKYRQKDLKRHFRNEYLGQLIQRSKIKHCHKLNVGEIVLIDNDNMKRMNWLFVRVIKLIPGKDEVVHLVRSKTTSGELL